MDNRRFSEELEISRKMDKIDNSALKSFSIWILLDFRLSKKPTMAILISFNRRAKNKAATLKSLKQCKGQTLRSEKETFFGSRNGDVRLMKFQTEPWLSP